MIVYDYFLNDKVNFLRDLVVAILFALSFSFVFKKILKK